MSCPELLQQSPTNRYKPPADCRGAQMYYVMQSMTRASQQERRGVLEFRGQFIIII